MGKLSLGGVLDCLCLSSNSRSCFCINSLENQDEFESKPLVASEGGNLVKLNDVLEGPQTLAFQLKPKMVVLRLSMHCNGCARKVERHISKMEDSATTTASPLPKLPYVPCRGREVAQAHRFLHHAHSSSWCLQKERYQTI